MISVIICTYNRCESLKDTLNSLLSQECDGSFDYEVIVVDNNSKDKTKEVVKSYQNKLNGRLRYIFELHQGKSYALNHGIKEAKGEIIAFTDDDVTVDKRWLFYINETFIGNNCDGLGGKILPVWETPPPNWLPRGLWPNLALLDYGPVTFYVTSKERQFYGANFAFKKNLFEKYGYFNTIFGPQGKKLTRGEDTELFDRFLDNGCKLLYNPKVFVYHFISKERLKKQYFRKWQFYYAHYYAHTNLRIKASASIVRICFNLMDKIFSSFYCFLKRDIKNRTIHEVKIFYCLGQLQWKLSKILRRNE